MNVSERMFDDLFDVFWESTFKAMFTNHKLAKSEGGPLEHLSKIPEKDQRNQIFFMFGLFFKFLAETGFFIGEVDWRRGPGLGSVPYLLKKNIKQSTLINRIKGRFAEVQAELKEKNNKPAKPEGSK